MKILITVLLTFMLTLLCFNISAQTRNCDATIGIAYGTDIEEIGLQIGFLSSFAPNMKWGLDFVWWLVDTTGWDELTFAEINLNYYFMFSQGYGMDLYGLATLGYHYYQGKIGYYEIDDSELAVGFGAGVEFELRPIKFYVEPRLFLSGYDQLVISGGIRYSF